MDIKYWTAGNDGSGSGLDADKLDGYHSYMFMIYEGERSDDRGTQGYVISFEQRTDTGPVGYTSGGQITFNGNNSRFSMYAPSQEDSTSALYIRTGYNTDLKSWTRVFTDDYHPEADTLNGLSDSAFAKLSEDNVFTGSTVFDGATGQLFVARQFGVNPPSIDLAIGDQDTGFDWASDGNLEFMANNVIVATMSSAAIELQDNKQLQFGNNADFAILE